MNAINLQRLRYGSHPEYAPGDCVCTISHVAPQIRVEGSPPGSSPAPSERSYNLIPLRDMHYLASLKKSDSLHRADLMAADAKRGSRLSQYVSEHGTDAFIKNYQ